MDLRNQQEHNKSEVLSQLINQSNIMQEGKRPFNKKRAGSSGVERGTADLKVTRSNRVRPFPFCFYFFPFDLYKMRDNASISSFTLKSVV